MRLEPGETVDRYVVEAPLGEGGTAVVYRVRHARLGTRHALKLLTISGESIKRRLLQEGKAQAMLGHLNVVAVTDVVEVRGQPGLLMEYVEGPSLEDALGEYRIGLAEAELLFQGVLAGVRAAHELGLVHRDLKPANVLLAPTDAGFVPKVTDFGLAKALRGEPLREGTTRQGVAMGTPSYMAPEQIRDAGKVDERADVFSLGCLLYELVTRRRAFPGEDTLDIYNRIAHGSYVPARRLVPDLPERFEQAIRGCLQVDRARRIPDTDTLRAVLAGERTWDHGVDPETLPEPPSLPSLGDVPPITLAPRDLDGSTPAPAPSRAAPPPAAPGGRLAAAALVLGSLAVLGFVLVFAAVGVSLPVLLAPPPSAKVRVEAPLPAPAAPSEPAPAPPPDPSPVAEPAPADPAPRAAAPRPAPVAALVPVKILSVPPTAAIRVDGQPSGRATNAKLDLAAGRHRIELESGGRTLRFDIRVGPGEPERWCAVFASGTATPGDCPR